MVEFMKFVWQDKKKWPLNTGDCLIEVTAWAGLIVVLNINYPNLCLWCWGDD